MSKQVTPGESTAMAAIPTDMLDERLSRPETLNDYLALAWKRVRTGDLGVGTIVIGLAVIWAMIGLAGGTVGYSITIATACVLGISALAVVLVRVTT